MSRHVLPTALKKKKKQDITGSTTHFIMCHFYKTYPMVSKLMANDLANCILPSSCTGTLY